MNAAEYDICVEPRPDVMTITRYRVSVSSGEIEHTLTVSVTISDSDMFTDFEWDEGAPKDYETIEDQIMSRLP